MLYTFSAQICAMLLARSTGIHAAAHLVPLVKWRCQQPLVFTGIYDVVAFTLFYHGFIR
jgi:hypothetical protein